MTESELFDQLRQHAAKRGKDVTIHSNPEVPNPPAWYGLACVHPGGFPFESYAAGTLREALEIAWAAVAFQDALDGLPPLQDGGRN